MKKEEYMGALKNALVSFDEELAQEIVNDYEERFRVGLEKGKTEEQVIAELGSIKDLVDELGEMQQGVENTAGYVAGNAKDNVNEKESTENREDTNYGSSGTYYQEKSFAESFDAAMKKFGKVFDNVMKEAGKVIEEAAEQIEIHMEEAKKNHSYTYNGDGSFTDTYEGCEKDMEGEPSVEQSGQGGVCCHRVEVDADIADVVVHTTNEEEPRAVCHYYSHKTAMLYPFYTKQEGATFYVGVRRNRDTDKKSGFFRFGMSPSIKIELFLPSGVTLLEISSNSGDIDLNEVVTETMVLRSKSGDISASNLVCDRVRIETMSGDAEVQGTPAANMEISTASGDIEVTECRGQYLEAKAASGDIDIKAEYKKCVAKCQSGDVSIELLHDSDIIAKSASGDVDIRLVEAAETYQVNMHSVSGECTTGGKTKSESLVPTRSIEAKTVSGDVSVMFC